MFDNINIYRGRAKYIRLNQKAVPIQWNFTVRAALTPNISDITDLFANYETASKLQGSVSKLDETDLLIG